MSLPSHWVSTVSVARRDDTCPFNSPSGSQPVWLEHLAPQFSHPGGIKTKEIMCVQTFDEVPCKRKLPRLPLVYPLSCMTMELNKVRDKALFFWIVILSKTGGDVSNTGPIMVYASQCYGGNESPCAQSALTSTSPPFSRLPLLATPPPPALGCYAVSMAAASSDPTFTRRLEPIKVK